MISDTQLFTIKDYLELIYFISGGPILVIIAGVALLQIKVSKEQIKITSKRESIKLAAEQCNFYIKEIIPLQNQLDMLFIAKKINLKNNTIKIDGDTVIGKFDYEIIKKILEDDECINLITSLANKMESFSTYFSNELADNEIAYNTIGLSFINSIKKYYSLIFLYENSNEIIYYKNNFKLFINWYNKSENENKIKLIKKLEDEKNNLMKKSTDLKDKKIKKSIGT